MADKVDEWLQMHLSLNSERECEDMTAFLALVQCTSEYGPDPGRRGKWLFIITYHIKHLEDVLRAVGKTRPR